jgi:ABC-type transporter Mla maintaining outer membrane lipid asymmetry ATPase subunit MlaF
MSGLRVQRIELSTRRLSVRFGETLALSDVSLTISPGQSTLVSGPAQSGKTTLLKCLAGLIQPSAGQVLWNGERIDTLAPEKRMALRSTMAMVFQSDALFDSLTAVDNVKLPLERRGLDRREATERAMDALQAVGLESAAALRPEAMSGGMRKRLGLARALASQPQTLIADDPFAGLDVTTTQVVAKLLNEQSRAGTLVVAMPEEHPALTCAVKVAMGGVEG